MAIHQGTYSKTVATYSELRLLMSEIRKWLAGAYGSPAAGVTLLIKPSDFEHAILSGALTGNSSRAQERFSARRTG